MSSEESDVDDEDEVLTLHPLPWRAEVDTLFRKLDKNYPKGKVSSSSKANEEACTWY